MANATWIGEPTAEPTTATVRHGLAYYVDSPGNRFIEAIEEEPDAFTLMDESGSATMRLDSLSAIAAVLSQHRVRFVGETRGAEMGLLLLKPDLERVSVPAAATGRATKSGRATHPVNGDETSSGQTPGSPSSRELAAARKVIRKRPARHQSEQ